MTYTPNPHVPVVDQREQRASNHRAIPAEALVAAGVAPHRWSPDYAICMRCEMNFEYYARTLAGCLVPAETVSA